MTKFIGIVSGKGGVGKTTTTVNVGHALHSLGKNVIVLDANLVTPNLSLHLGHLNPQATLNKFLRKEKSLKQITHGHESGLTYIPSSPSYSEYQKTNPQKLVEIFEHLDNTYDFVLIDCPSGVGYELTQILKHCDETVIVATPTLSSVMDALKTIHLAKANDNVIAGVLLNMTNYGWHELKEQEVENILGYQILANIRMDRKIRKSLHKQTPLHFLHPRSRSSKEFRKVAEFLCKQPI